MPERAATLSQPPGNNGGRRRLFVRLVSILVTVALLAVLVGEVKWDEFDQLLGRVAAGSWLGALLAYLLLNLFRALRFRVLLDKDDSPWRLLVPITLYHNFLVRALPFKLGELSYIALLRSRLNYSMEEGLSSLFGARLLELLIIMMVFASGVLTTAEALAAQRDQLLFVVALTFAASVVALYFGGALIRALLTAALPFLRRLMGREPGILTVIKTRSLQLASELDRIRQPRLFLTALFISCFTYSSSFLTNYILLRALGITVDLWAMIAIISIGMFASAFPFNVSGFGVVEVAWRFALVQFAGWTESDATATGFLLHGFQLFAAAAYGLAGYLIIQLSPQLPPHADNRPNLE
ncbi:MAG: lysylphosphatidylglycerol synthase transmembrane domain-containing protein [Chloroflexi bacterium]|nr:lysylphosphatidylglycerol synthase transmembrane domain-containing protein [Chloroflexota bacterium]